MPPYAHTRTRTMHSAAALPSATGLILTYARLCAALMTRIPPCRCFALGVDPGWEGDEGRALVYRYVWRDDLSDTFDESVRV